MKIQVIKPFKWCVGSDIHPTDFAEGIYDVDNAVADGAIGAGWATLLQEQAIERPFAEAAGSESSALPQAQASTQKIAEKSQKKEKKAGA